LKNSPEDDNFAGNYQLVDEESIHRMNSYPPGIISSGTLIQAVKIKMHVKSPEQ
jgi:hypothetical protein